MLVKSPAFKHKVTAPKNKCRMPRCSGTMSRAPLSEWKAEFPQKLVGGKKVDRMGKLFKCNKCNTTVHVHAIPEPIPATAFIRGIPPISKEIA